MAGPYEVTWRFYPEDENGTARLVVNNSPYEQPLLPGDSMLVFDEIPIPAGPLKIEAALIFPDHTRGVHQMDMSGL